MEKGTGGGGNGSDRFATIKKHPRRNDEALHTRVGDVCVCINNAGLETPICNRVHARALCLRILPLHPSLCPSSFHARAFVAILVVYESAR